MSDFFSLEIFKRHPYWTGGGVLIGGVALWYFFLRGNSGAASSVQVTTNPATPDPQAEQMAMQLALAQLSANTQIALQTQQLGVKSQEDAYSFQLGEQQINASSDATDKQFQLQEDALQTQAAMQAQALQTQLQEQQAGYNANIEGMKITANSAISQETIAANLQQNLAAINAQLNAHAIDAQSTNFQAQLSTQALINGQNVAAQENSSDDSMWGSIIGAAAMIAIAA